MSRLLASILFSGMLVVLLIGAALTDASPPTSPVDSGQPVPAAAVATPTPTWTPKPTPTFSPAGRGLCVLACDDANHNNMCDAGEHAIAGESVNVYDVATFSQLLATYTFTGQEVEPICWANAVGLRRGEFAVRAAPPTPFWQWGSVYASPEDSVGGAPLPPPGDAGNYTYTIEVNSGRTLYFALDLHSSPASSPTPTATPVPVTHHPASDFNGDGRSDILWRNGSNGANSMWLTTRTEYVNWSFLDPVTGADWKVVGVGDFSGDGKADILWRNATSIGKATCRESGSTLVTLAFLTPV